MTVDYFIRHLYAQYGGEHHLIADAVRREWNCDNYPLGTYLNNFMVGNVVYKPTNYTRYVVYMGEAREELFDTDSVYNTGDNMFGCVLIGYINDAEGCTQYLFLCPATFNASPSDINIGADYSIPAKVTGDCEEFRFEDFER